MDIIRSPHVVCGPNALEQLSTIIAQASSNSVLLITHGESIKTGTSVKCINTLKKNCKVSIYDEVEPEPKLKNVKEAVEFAKQCNVDCVVALGGGSVIDTAKAVAVLVSGQQQVTEMLGVNQVTNIGLPLIAIPTT